VILFQLAEMTILSLIIAQNGLRATKPLSVSGLVLQLFLIRAAIPAPLAPVLLTRVYGWRKQAQQ